MSAAPRTKTPKSLRVPLVIAGIAAILLAGVTANRQSIEQSVYATFAGLNRFVVRDAMPDARAGLDADALTGTGAIRVKLRCDECGFVESMRWVEAGNSTETYEITVRMRDGTAHINRDPNPANWRPGERIILIGGANPSGR